MIQTLTGIESSASALAAERVRMEVITQNIANANTTRGLDGKPYQRQHVIFEKVLDQAQGMSFGPQRVEITRIEKDHRPARLVFNPGHPDANADGMVAIPNINIHEEMADLIVSSRAFEANLAVVKNARTMALQTLSIGKR
ncbi:MAG TPA: flagellar basal body rod protein FlgC [Verrucomicrobiae bacterium]|nr:flagellar basal body rod protein FlgC [Verrucomicrobiae bacterium]